MLFSYEVFDKGFYPGVGGGGVLNISFGGEVRPGTSNPDPVCNKNCPIFDILLKTFSLKLYPV